MIHRPNRPVAAVMLEGTLSAGWDYATRDLGRLIPGAKESVETLARTHFIIIVSAFCGGRSGRQKVALWLSGNGVPYDAIHEGLGYPAANVRYDSGAVALPIHPTAIVQAKPEPAVPPAARLRPPIDPLDAMLRERNDSA